MSQSELEKTILAYYLAGPAGDLSVAPRFYPYGELLLIFEDKVSIAVRKFGPKVRAHAKAVGKLFIDAMLERGAWSTKEGEYGGSMHQFQADMFKTVIQDMQASDPIIAQARAEGPEFWEKTFAGLAA
ncbi:hypothetical protein [Novosphingobium album (ex Liu et al. 2023)]|uniref:Globin n=1 Tax=Novosphingobium album (ex Liu et al. 2023) TaxID=3031130 RepID=A0ABT5WUU7_9SPHN|nr:hypothetical protein [Novosphingobium album (ex Liu et al. 2023)]MDE8653633.1 hypothetical protein [Novosphingobium album (ex Liu et al. 2023)]